MEFVYSLLLLGAVALVAGIILTIAAKFMAVPVDPNQIKVRECLPGANCGACGFAGCDDYAGAVAADPNVPVNACVPGGAAVAEAIAAALGREAGDEADPLVARVACRGTCDKKKKVSAYTGFRSCKMAAQTTKAGNACQFGCIGFGDCVAACKFGAMDIIDGVAVVNRSKCVGCGACANACPQNLITIAKASSRVFVGCSSEDKGADTRKVCEAGCIACGKCMKTCKFDAISIVDNHAVIDPEKCKNCGMCAKECPMHIIQVVPRNFTK